MQIEVNNLAQRRFKNDLMHLTPSYDIAQSPLMMFIRVLHIELQTRL